TNPDGKALVSARNHILITLMQIDEVKHDKAKAERDAQTAAKAQGTGQAPKAIDPAWEDPLVQYQRLLAKIGSPGKPSSLDLARSMVQSWIDSLLKSPLVLSERRLDEFLGKMRKVRQKDLKIVEIRSCFLGSKRFTLQVLRKFLGADIVGAPDELSCFGPLRWENPGSWQ